MSKKKKNTSPNSKFEIRNSKPELKWAYIFLFSFAVLLYANTLTHEFAFDDSVVITGNKYTKMGFEGIKTLATTDLFYGIYGNALDLEGGRWRPLTLVMFAIEYQVFGDNAHPYHLINVLLYGLTAVILFMTLMSMFSMSPSGGQLKGGSEARGGGLLAFITTLLFIAHPIHTEVVANIKSRDEIVSFLFLCLALLFLFRFVKSEKTKFIFYGAMCYFLALLSKENGITFIAVVPLALFCFAWKNMKQSLMLILPFLAVAMIYLTIRTSMVGMIGDRVSNDLTDNPFLQINFPGLPTPVPFMEKFATVCWILLKYIWILIFPHPLTSDYAFNEVPAISLSDPKAIGSLIIYSGLFFYAVKTLWDKRKKTETLQPSHFPTFKTILAFSILFHLCTISIVSNLFFLIGTNMGERFVYITSLGFCLALASILIRVFKWESASLQKPATSIRQLYLLLLLLIPYTYKTLTRNPDWKNNKALFTADVKTSTGSANAHYYYANTLFTEHMEDPPGPKRDSLFLEAKKEFIRAMQINPYFHYCYYNIGMIWEKMGFPDSAIVYQEKVIRMKPENTMAQYMAKGALGLVYGKLKGDIDKAMPLLKEALSNKPDDVGYHENLGICYAMKKDFENSIKEFETALRLKPELKKEDARLFMNIALSWQNKGEKQKADENFQKAFQLDPSLKK